MFLLGTQLLQNRRIDRRNEGLNKRIGPDSSELVNRNKGVWVAIGCPKVVNPSKSDYLDRI